MLEVRGDLEALVAEAHRRIEQRALEEEAAAEKRAAETLAIARREAGASLEEHRRRARLEAAEIRRRVAALGVVQARRAALQRREALLDGIWEGARRELEAVADDPGRYLAALRRLASLASRTLAEDEVVLASDVRGHPLLTSERLQRWGHEDGVRYLRAASPAELAAGLLASAGRLRVDASFENRLAEARLALREALLGRLLTGSGAAGSGRNSSDDNGRERGAGGPGAGGPR